MVNGINGQTFSFKELPIYQKYYEKYEDYLEKNGYDTSSMSFDLYLRKSGNKTYFLQGLEDYIEGNGGDGVNGNLLSAAKYVVNGNNALYQSVDEDTYYDFDFENGTYTVYTDESDVAELLGLDNETFDTIEFSFGGVTVTDYTFGNLSDGQDSYQSKTQGGKYRATYENQEFDLDYILDIFLMNEDDPQFQIAAEIFQEICDNIDQWCPKEYQEELNALAEQYGTSSPNYKLRMKEIILECLDQAKEWDDDHTHLEYVPESSGTTDGTTGTTSSDDTTTDATEYDKDVIIHNSGYGNYYHTGEYLCSEWDNDGTNKEAMNRTKNALFQEFDNLFASLVTQLQAQIGSAWTSEMDARLLYVKAELLDLLYLGKGENVDADIIDDQEVKKGSWIGGLDKKGAGTWCYILNVQKFCDKFFELFDNSKYGTTDEEIATAQQKESNLKSGYNSLYNMDMCNIAKSENVPSTLTLDARCYTDMYDAYDVIEDKVITPVKDQIKSQLKGKVPEEDLDKIFEAAYNDMITSGDINEYIACSSDMKYYTVNTQGLLQVFESTVKARLEDMGYPKD